MPVTSPGGRSVAGQVIGRVPPGISPVVTLGTGTIPAPAEVHVLAPVANLPRPAARVFEGRDAALALLAEEPGRHAAVVVTSGRAGQSELALHYATGTRAVTG